MSRPILFRAVAKGDAAEVRRLVEEGYDVDEYFKEGSANSMGVIITAMPPFTLIFIIAISTIRPPSITRCPVPLTVRGTQVLVGFAPLAPSVFCAARQNAVLRRSPLRPT